jgi:IS30 family transposase
VISVGLRQRLSYGRIGELIGRDKSVVSREVARNRGRGGCYRGPVAHGSPMSGAAARNRSGWWRILACIGGSRGGSMRDALAG